MTETKARGAETASTTSDTKPIAGDRFLVMGNGIWAKGPTLAAAKATYKGYGGSLAVFVAAEATQPADGNVWDVWVAGDGSFRFDWVEGQPRTGTPTLTVVAKRGFDVKVGDVL